MNNLQDASRAASTFAVRYTTLRIARRAMTNGQFATSVCQLPRRQFGVSAQSVRRFNIHNRECVPMDPATEYQALGLDRDAIINHGPDE
jgi:hypothetical protein